MKRLLPTSVALGVAPVAAPPELPLAQSEAALIRGAAEKRRLEFAAGRHLARRLLRRLGAEVEAVLRQPDGSPRWPDAYVGSISHCTELCIAAVAPRREVAAVGVDIEPRRPLEQELWDELFTAAEQRWLLEHDSSRVPWSRVLFSAKEALYKSQLVCDVASFQDIEMEVDGETMQARCHGVPVVGLDGLRFRAVGHWLLTACWGLGRGTVRHR